MSSTEKLLPPSGLQQQEVERTAFEKGGMGLTGEPVEPSWMRTLTMSMGWMTVVAIMPERPPLTNGFAAFQAWLSDICSRGKQHEGPGSQVAIHGSWSTDDASGGDEWCVTTLIVSIDGCRSGSTRGCWITTDTHGLTNVACAFVIVEMPLTIRDRYPLLLVEHRVGLLGDQ